MISKDKIEELQEHLLRRRRQILEQLENFEEALAYLEQSRPPEFSEEAQEEAAASSLKALDEQERRELGDITTALEKLEAGTYGVCEICKNNIDLERLTALPMVRLCISCQKQTEEATRP
jgi:DnaK suppressor protein